MRVLTGTVSENMVVIVVVFRALLHMAVESGKAGTGAVC